MTDFKMVEPKDLELFHYGVKGMKWGVRRKRETARRNAYRNEVNKALDSRKKADKRAYDKADRWVKKNVEPKLKKKYEKFYLEDRNKNLTKAGEDYLRERFEAFDRKFYEYNRAHLLDNAKRLNYQHTDFERRERHE